MRLRPPLGPRRFFGGGFLISDPLIPREFLGPRPKTRPRGPGGPGPPPGVGPTGVSFKKAPLLGQKGKGESWEKGVIPSGNPGPFPAGAPQPPFLGRGAHSKKTVLLWKKPGQHRGRSPPPDPTRKEPSIILLVPKVGFPISGSPPGNPQRPPGDENHQFSQGVGPPGGFPRGWMLDPGPFPKNFQGLGFLKAYLKVGKPKPEVFLHPLI